MITSQRPSNWKRDLRMREKDRVVDVKKNSQTFSLYTFLLDRRFSWPVKKVPLYEIVVDLENKG